MMLLVRVSAAMKTRVVGSTAPAWPAVSPERSLAGLVGGAATLLLVLLAATALRRRR